MKWGGKEKGEGGGYEKERKGPTPQLEAMGVQTATSQSWSDSFKGILCMRQI